MNINFIFSAYFKRQLYQSILIFSLLIFLLSELCDVFFLPYLLRWSFIFIELLLDICLCLTFFSRLIHAWRYRSFLLYLRENLGLDLANSFIPLILYSLPSFFLSLHSSLSTLENSLWFPLYFYQARYLRLLRFYSLSFTFMPTMAQNSKSLISIERIFLLCFFVPFAIFLIMSLGTSQLQAKNPFLEIYIKEITLPSPHTNCKILQENWPFILAIEENYPEGNQTIYTRHIGWRNYFGTLDYLVIKRGFINFYIDKSPMIKYMAQIGVFFFLINFAIFLGLTYLNNFLLKTFIEPSSIIFKGLTDPLEFRRVNVKHIYRDEPIFKLARHYNNHILLEKLQKNPESRIPFCAKELQTFFPSTQRMESENE